MFEITAYDPIPPALSTVVSNELYWGFGLDQEGAIALDNRFFNAFSAWDDLDCNYITSDIANLLVEVLGYSVKHWNSIAERSELWHKMMFDLRIAKAALDDYRASRTEKDAAVETLRKYGLEYGDHHKLSSDYPTIASSNPQRS